MDTETHTSRCMMCGKPSEMQLPITLEEVAAWGADPFAPHVQDMFPQLTPEQLEFLITGTHPECWPEEPED